MTKFDLRLFLLTVLCLAFSTVQAAPRLFLETQKVELGEVMHGEFAKGQFVIKNVGDAPLDVSELEISCGCAVVDFKPTVLAVGDELSLDVSVDTIGKVGEIRKKITILSNDPLSPETPVYVYVRVAVADHDVIDSAAIFKGDCQFCHAGTEASLQGEPLFESVCFMCHGHYGLGGLAKRINDFGYVSNHDDEHFRSVITNGLPGTSMPAFAAEHGGPLTNKQIESLVTLMRWWEDGFVFKANEERR